MEPLAPTLLDHTDIHVALAARDISTVYRPLTVALQARPGSDPQELARMARKITATRI